MSAEAIAVIGSGIAATAITDTLVRAGHEVTIFEKGPDYPYPHLGPFEDLILRDYENPAYALPADVRGLTLAGDYRHDLDAERGMVVGGSTTHWTGMTLRMSPEDFATRTRYGFGRDWPISYAELEPYYGRAEFFMGVSGTDADNPFAPRRSRPFPLPPFELGYWDEVFRDRLRQKGIVLHTTPQARTRRPYDGRPACTNFGTCNVCPIGARYSPTHQLVRAQQTGRCHVRPNTTVRRIVLDSAGRARAIVYQENNASSPVEFPARLIIVAAGALESARLLLLSTSEHYPDGLGNKGGHVGQHLVFHHLWDGSIHYQDKVLAGRVGPVTGQSHQFRNPSKRGRHGGIKIEFSSHYTGDLPVRRPIKSAADLLEDMQALPHRRGIYLHAESVTGPEKYLGLSTKKDRFGDPLAHIQYRSSEFDQATHQYARELYESFAHATAGEIVGMRRFDEYDSGAHHMGTCRMGNSASDSVVDSYGKIHGVKNVYVVGASMFVGCSGAVNPTLTLLALSLRTADHIAHELGARRAG